MEVAPGLSRYVALFSCLQKEALRSGKILRVAKSGLKIENAEIPSGSHRLFLRIADSKERVTETEVRFAVE